MLGAGTPSRTERLASLPDEDRRWITEYVAPIILPEEEALFLELTRPDQRELFKEEFWKRRERDGLPFPLGPGYRRAYEELRLRADHTYDGWRSDAGRMVIAHGEPASIDNLEACKGTFPYLEIWTYAIPTGRGTRRHFFYRRAPGAPRRLWTYGTTADSEVFSPGACRKTFESLGNDCIAKDPRTDRCLPASCNEMCSIYQLYVEIRGEGSVGGHGAEAGRLLDRPALSTEGLDGLRRRFADVAGETAKPIAVESPGASPAPLAGGAGATIPKLTSRERAERLRSLSAEDRVWLTDYVAPIIVAAERDLFLQLTTDYHREAFRREFWARRERPGLPPPLGPGYETRYAQLREIANASYEGTNSDAGRMVVRKGEPAEVQELLACSEVYRQAEIWSYPGGERHLFFRPAFGAPRRLWMSGDTAIFQTSSCLASFDEACATPGSGPRRNCPSNAIPKTCRDACAVAAVAGEIESRGLREGSAITEPPAISTEGFEGLWLRLASVSTPGARPISLGGATRPPPAAPDEPPEPAPAWSNEKIRDAILALPKKYRDWVDLAGPLVTRSELVDFLRLRPGDRDGWVRKFWKRHGHVD